MPAKPQAAAQIRELDKLTQAAAARLLGVTPRTLRDAYDAPRNPDGSYHAAKLVRWWHLRGDRPDGLTDEEHELIAKAGDMDYAAVNECLASPLAERLTALHAKHGPALLVELGDVLLSNIVAVGAHYQNYADPEMLRVATICEKCKSLRRGRRWVKSKPPADVEVIRGGCPQCFPITEG